MRYPFNQVPARRRTARNVTIVFMLLAFTRSAFSAATPAFYFGNDLSYVNQMEDCGAVYRENGVAKDPYVIFAEHGTNLVRVRLWNDPWWHSLIPQTVPGVKPQYSDLADVIETITRAKAAGMQVLLDWHFSDFWADPGRQVVPRAWSSLMDDDAALAAALHEYVTEVLTTLNARGLMPELVQIGNETNGGLMFDRTLDAAWNSTTNQMDIAIGGPRRSGDVRHALLWNAAIRAVREVGATANINPRICLHVAGPGNAVAFFDWMQQIGVTDFDIMGLSYYYTWHGGTIASTGAVLRDLRARHPAYEVMLLETGYLWDEANIDGLNNIISTPDPAFLPVSPETQRRYMVALTQEVIDAGGIGVIFWESAWVSTPCRTPWGVGSSHEHVAYFDHRDGNNFHVGGTWMEADYSGLPPKVTVAPAALTVRDGTQAYFSVATREANPTFQWRRNGADLPGATGASLFLTDVTAVDAGTYSVIVGNAYGTTESAGATLALSASGTAQMVNLSARAQVGRGDGVVIPGLVVQGDVALTALVRAIGPGLLDYGVSGVLEDPQLTVYRSLPGGGNEFVGRNNEWEDNADVAGLVALSRGVGAFDLAAGSHDAAMPLVLSPGAYTVVVSGVGDTEGVALMEVYLVAP